MKHRRGPKPTAEVVAMRAKALAFHAAHDIGDGLRRGYLQRYASPWITREQAAADARRAAALAEQYLNPMKAAA